MCRFIPLLLIALLLPAQTPPRNLDQPPQDIDDALRARIKRFYDFHVERKYRLCEELVLEDAKDDFYVLTKPPIDGYKIGNIEYTENFSKAKVVIVGTIPVMMPMAGARIMEQPFASFWTREKGTWFWYYNKTEARHTPFGEKKSTDPKGADSAPEAPRVTIEELQSAVKIERTEFDLAGDKAQTVKLTNTLPGPVALSIDCPLMPIAQTGITAAFDKKSLKASETATLTLSAGAKARAGSLPLRIVVSPTNQVLDLTVTVKP